MVIDVNLPPENPEADFEDFFRNFEDEPNHFKYREEIQEAAIKNNNIIYVLFEDILLYNPVLADFLRNEPEIALEYATNTFKDLLRFYSGGSIDEDRDYFVRITTKNRSNEVKLRGLRAAHIDKLIYIYGILIRASQIIPQIKTAIYQCPVCQTQMEIEQLDTVLMPPKQCANPNCKNKKGFIVIAKDSKFIDWQSITIQELPEELQPGRVPYSVKGILTHDLVDKVRPGDRVKITGIYKTYPTEDRRGKKTTLFRSYIKILSIEGTSANDESLDITPEELAEIKRWSLKPDIQKIIANSVAPSILGNEHLKLAAALALFGGVRKILRDGSARRGDIHVLFVGDPGTGKSQILKQCALIAPQPVYTSGKGSSAAGLTAAVVKESDSGGLSLEAGAIVLADGGNAMIDEFDKMDKKDRVAIHEAMEQQTVSVAKAGIIATLRARTSIIAAANPKKGRYDIYKTPKENINLSPPILSRFDLIFVVKDEPDDERDERIADFILSLHSDLGANTGANPNQQAYIPIPLLKKYIQYAKKNVFPKLTPEAIEVIKNFYIELRKSNANNENSAVAVVARSLEGYIRLAEAYAKMALRSYVTKEDAEEAVKLARKSIEDISLDPITGTINADRIYTDKPSTKSMVDKILSFLKQKVEELGGPVKEDDFIEDLLIEVDLDEKKLRYYIDLLINNGVVYRPRDGLLAIIAGNKKQDDGN